MSDQKKTRVAVLGSNAFSASDFIEFLLSEQRFEILGISRSPLRHQVFRSYAPSQNGPFHFYQYDFNKDMPALIKELDRFEPDYIVNFAAQSEVAPSWKHPEHWFQTNTVALAKLINALKDRSYLQKYLHISSPEVYGTCQGYIDEQTPLNPSTPYAASKAAADLLLKTFFEAYDFPLVTVRATNVYGAYQQLFKIIPRTIIYAKLCKTLKLHGGGKAVKSYIHIRDVSRGELAILESAQPGELYHLSPDRGWSIRELVEKILLLMSKDFDTCVQSTEERLGQDAAYTIDSSKARKAFNWQPQVGIDHGLEKVVQWIESTWETIKELPHEYQHQA